MLCSLSELHGKEVISLKTGEKLGFVDDIEFDSNTAQVKTLVIFGRERFFGFLGREDDVKIPFEDIHLIGKDAILINSREGEVIKSKSFVFENTYNRS